MKLSPLVGPCAAAPAQSTTSTHRSLRFSPRSWTDVSPIHALSQWPSQSFIEHKEKDSCGCPWRLVSWSQVERWASRLACEVVFIYVFVKPYLRGQNGGAITWPVFFSWIPAQVSRMFSFPKKKRQPFSLPAMSVERRTDPLYSDGERVSGPVLAPRAGPAPGDVQSPAMFPRRRTPVLRPLPLIIVIISHRAIEDPCHHPHLGRLPTVSHRPVIMREDERAPIALDLRTSPDGKCSCLPRSPSLPRRELSLWSLRPARQLQVDVPAPVTGPAQVTDHPGWPGRCRLGHSWRPSHSGRPSHSWWRPSRRQPGQWRPGRWRFGQWWPGGRPSHSWFIWQLSSSVWWPGGVRRPNTSSGGGNGWVGRPWNPGRNHTSGWTRHLHIDRDKQSAFPINTDLHQPGNADRLYVYVDIITASDGPGYGSRYLGQPGCTVVSACSQTWLNTQEIRQAV